MPRIKQFDRQDVLNRAMELFWKKGFHATSIQDLVDHCGINRASMYGSFGGKEQLFKEAIQLYQTKSGAYFTQISQILEKKTIREFLSEYFLNGLEAIIEDKDNKGCMFVNVTTELCNQNKDISSFLRANMNGVVTLFKDLLKMGQERQEIARDRDPESLARHLFTFYNGLNVIVKMEKDPETLKDLIDQQLNYIFG